MKLKLIAAALAALAAAAPAQADIATAGSGNGEFFLSVWDEMGTADTADDRSYTRDLGLFLNEFANTAPTPALGGSLGVLAPGFNLTFVADTLLQDWLSQSADPSRIRWNVMAGDSNGTARFASTVSAGTTFGANINMTPAQMNTAGSKMDQYLGAVNALNSNGNVNNDIDTDESITATFADGIAYAGGVGFGNSVGGTVTWKTSGALGESLDFWLMYNSATSGTTNKGAAKQFRNNYGDATWTLASNGTLTYLAPVPEPETYALMMAGLGLVGLMARRRKA